MSDESGVSVHIDEELLSLATELLSSEEFEVHPVEVDGLKVVVGENPYFIVAVVAASTTDQLLHAEDPVVSYLTSRMKEVELGPKVWDAYVVLLTQEKIVDPSLSTGALFALNYDTTAVRRIAHVGVEPTMFDIRKSLAPFVRPVVLDDEVVGEDPFDSFVNALVEEGVEEDFAYGAVAVFRKGGDINDVL